jgi:Staphylococcal nuclease homologue
VINENCKVWACGEEAYERLKNLVGGRVVTCEDRGPDRAYRNNRRVCVCRIEGELTSLNELLVREGLALNFEPYARGRFKADQDDAERNRPGLWNGCFTAPTDHRRGNKSKAPLMGAACSCDSAKSIPDKLYPDDPAMPPDCPIKGKFAGTHRHLSSAGLQELSTHEVARPLVLL